MRYSASRESFIPKQGAITVRAKNCEAVVYLTDNASGRPCAMGFYGKAQRPTFHYNFKSEERRAQYVAQWFKDMADVAARKAARKAEKKTFAHSLNVGDVLRTSWGYDQTNIEYFEVTKVIGKSVEIREIAQDRQETAWAQGLCVPAVGQYIGPVMRKLVQEGNSVKIHSFAYAHPVAATIVAGAKVYGSSHWTAYA